MRLDSSLNRPETIWRSFQEQAVARELEEMPVDLVRLIVEDSLRVAGLFRERQTERALLEFK
jgi:hypothetical protein